MKCPICGQESGETSVTCSKHISFTYDKDGNLIDHSDVVIIPPKEQKDGTQK
jgi:hypothetical protein